MTSICILYKKEHLDISYSFLVAPSLYDEFRRSSAFQLSMGQHQGIHMVVKLTRNMEETFVFTRTLWVGEYFDEVLVTPLTEVL